MSTYGSRTYGIGIYEDAYIGTYGAGTYGEDAYAGSARVYAVIGPHAGWMDPTAAEIIAGTLSGGATAIWAGNYASPSVSGTYDWPSAASGLTAGTAYRVAVVWSDGHSTSNVGVGSFTTTSGAGVTIDCVVGDAAATGITASIVLGATISCSVGDALAEGLICNVSSSVTIGCEVGNATAAGASAAINNSVFTLTAEEIAEAVWNEPLAGATQARQIMSGMADFLRSRGFLP